MSEHASSFLVEDLGMEKVPTDVGCNFRTTVRGAGTHMQSLALTDSAGDLVWSNDGVTCDSTTLYLDAGSTYTITFGLSTEGVNDSVTMISDYSAVSYQPLLLAADGTALMRSEVSLSTEEPVSYTHLTLPTIYSV